MANPTVPRKDKQPLAPGVLKSRFNVVGPNIGQRVLEDASGGTPRCIEAADGSDVRVTEDQ